MSIFCLSSVNGWQAAQAISGKRLATHKRGRKTVHSNITKQLSDIELAYFDGAKFEKLSEKIVHTAVLIAAMDTDDPVRVVSETYAPMLWGAPSGSVIDPGAVKTALAGSNGNTHLRSWSGFGRALSAYKVAA